MTVRAVAQRCQARARRGVDFGEFNHIRELEVWMKRRDGQLGAPLPMLDFDMGEGEVLGSGQKDFVGAHITGYVAFDAPGTYRFRVTSNDGVRGQFDMRLLSTRPLDRKG